MTVDDVSAAQMIRHVRPAEYDAVGELTARAFLHWGFVKRGDSYVDVLRDVARRAEQAEVLVLPDGDEVLGTVTIAQHGSVYADAAEVGELEFRMLAVAPERGGRGVGRALVQAVVDRAVERGCHRVVLSSQPGMSAAQRIYGGLGFERLPERDRSPVPGLDLLAFGLALPGL